MNHGKSWVSESLPVGSVQVSPHVDVVSGRSKRTPKGVGASHRGAWQGCSTLPGYSELEVLRLSIKHNGAMLVRYFTLEVRRRSHGVIAVSRASHVVHGSGCG